MDASLRFRLERVQRALLPLLDIVAGRVDTPQIPTWCEERYWTEFLLGLSDAELSRCEAEGLARTAPELAGVPPTLAVLAETLRQLTVLPSLCSSPFFVEPAAAEHAFRGVGLRKRRQLSALLGALASLAPHARRIVDVGAGGGHFTRLSAAHFERDALGLERNPERVQRATARLDAPTLRSSRVRFEVLDAGRDRLELRAGDLAIGLHACGELGDTLVRAVAESGADLALVSCCLQKISSKERAPLSRAAGRFSLQKETLGLSNLTSQAMGVESSIEQTLGARQARYALRALLLGRGQDVAPGAEMRGINRRRAHSGLSGLAQQALAERGLQSATQTEISSYESSAALHFARMRRLSLPRNMLARAVELSVVLDRAAHLEESGYAVRVATLFERAITPRNISLFASRDGSRLPLVQLGRSS